MRARPLFVAVLALLAWSGALPAAAGDGNTLFKDGFETGNDEAWDAVGGGASYTGDQCHSGRFCGRMWLTGGRDQQSAFWDRFLRYGGDTVYVAGWWRFPKGYSFDRPSGSRSSFDHKAIILETAGGANRMFLNFQGPGTNPRLAVVVEQTPEDFFTPSGANIKADNRWHKVELEVKRVPNGKRGRMRVWFDGKLALDAPRITCPGKCAPIMEVKVGAYVNQGAARKQSFYLDDVVIAKRRPQR